MAFALFHPWGDLDLGRVPRLWDLPKEAGSCLGITWESLAAINNYHVWIVFIPPIKMMIVGIVDGITFTTL
jgi:hypothetical protein